MKRPIYAFRNILRLVGALLVAVAAYLCLWPVPIDPVSWTPPAPPAASGVFAVNERLRAVQRIDVGGVGPEDVAVDAQGRIYSGLEDGRIVRLAPDGSQPAVFARTGGRPLGLDFDGAGNLIVADAVKGLLSVDPQGKVAVLATEHGGRPFGFTDDVDVAPDGTIYFSDASSRWDIHHTREDVFEHRPHGRLLAYDPRRKQTRLVLDKLHFANGVAVSPDGAFVLVVEMNRYRVRRVWRSGPRRGQADMLIENLPALPDNISTGSDGRFWIALCFPRMKILDKLLPKPWVRKVIYRLPRFVQPDPVRHGAILAVDRDGRVLNNLQDPAPDSYSPITSVHQHGDVLYLGSNVFPGIGRLPLPPPGA